MANEFKHVTVGTELSQAEFEDTTLHRFDSQVAGDILYASSPTQLSRLPIGAEGKLLKVVSGLPSWGDAEITVVKSEIETINSNAVLHNDTELYFAAVASSIYLVKFYVDFTTSSTPDIKFGLAGPTGATIKWWTNGLLGATSATTAINPYTESSSIGITSPAAGIEIIEAIVTIGETAGNVYLQWCQNTSNAADTSVNANSFLQVKKIA